MYNINLDEILTKIKEVPIGKVTCVAELIDYSPKKDEDYIDVFEQMEIVKKVDTLLKNNNINIEYINDEKGGLPLYSKFQKTNMIDKENNESEIPDNIKDKIYKILSHNTGMNENIKIRKVNDNLYFAFGLPDENGIDSVVIGLDMSYLCGDSSRGMNNLISEYNSGKRSEELVLEKDESKVQGLEIDPIPYLEKLKTYSVEELKEEKHRLSNEAFSSIPQTDEEKQRKAMNIEYMKVIDKLLRTPRAQNEVVLSKIKDFIRFKDPREMYHYRQQDLEELSMYDDFKELPPKFKMWVDMAIREIYEDTKLAEMPFDTNNIPHIDLNAMVKAIDKAIDMEKNNDVNEKLNNLTFEEKMKQFKEKFDDRLFDAFTEINKWNDKAYIENVESLNLKVLTSMDPTSYIESDSSIKFNHEVIKSKLLNTSTRDELLKSLHMFKPYNEDYLIKVEGFGIPIGGQYFFTTKLLICKKYFIVDDIKYPYDENKYNEIKKTIEDFKEILIKIVEDQKKHEILKNDLSRTICINIDNLDCLIDYNLYDDPNEITLDYILKDINEILNVESTNKNVEEKANTNSPSMSNEEINNIFTNIDNFLSGSSERIRTPEETKLQEDKAEIRIRIELREKLAKAMRVYSDVEFPHVEIIKNNNQVYIDYPDEIMELRDYMLNSSYYNKEYNFDIQTIMNKSIPTLTADETFAYMYYILKAENQQKGYIANMINSNVFNMLCCRLYNYTYDLI